MAQDILKDWHEFVVEHLKDIDKEISEKQKEAKTRRVKWGVLTETRILKKHFTDEIVTLETEGKDIEGEIDKLKIEKAKYSDLKEVLEEKLIQINQKSS